MDYGSMWSRIYRTLWYPTLPLALLVIGSDARSRRERLGLMPTETEQSGRMRRVWVHAASVGEIEGVRPLVRRLAELRPELEFVVTTMTSAGREAAQRHLNGICQLAPFDHSATVRAFLARVRPVLVIIAETELWPNFFFQSAAAGASIALVNARLSTRSVSRYRWIRPLIASALSRANVIMTQTAEDAERFRRLGAAADRLLISGNTKYELGIDPRPLRPALVSFASGRPILIAGSTGPGEEQIVVTAYLHLRQRFPSLAMVLAPRHLNRLEEVEQVLRAARVIYRRATESNSIHEEGAAQNSELDPSVLLLDTMGELSGLYRRAAIAFVGGSLVSGRGGQSLAEPAKASVPVLFGPHYENHHHLGDALIAAGAGIVVHNATEIVDASTKWLADRAARNAAGHQASAVMEQLAGSTATTVRYLCALLPS